MLCKFGKGFSKPQSKSSENIPKFDSAICQLEGFVRSDADQKTFASKTVIDSQKNDSLVHITEITRNDTLDSYDKIKKKCESFFKCNV